MNLNDKNIDQIFRDAAQNSDAPRYDHSYWKEVNSMLNNEDKRKRGFILWSVAGSIIAALLISTLFILNDKEINSQLADNNNTSLNDSEVDHKNEVSQKEFNKTQTTSDQVFSEETNFTKSSYNSFISSNNVDKANKVERFANTAKTTKKADLNSSSEENTLKSNSPYNNSTENISVESSTSPLNSSASEKHSDLIETVSVESLSPKVISLQNPYISTDLLPLKLPKKNLMNFYAKLSAGLMENYETSRPFQSGVFDLSLNLEFNKEQVLFRTGLGLQATSNADLVVSERAKVYGFGITTHQNDLSYQSIYDIYIPLELGYSLNNTSFGVGAQMNYMLTTTMNYQSLENNIVVEEAKLKGFREGLNAVTAQGYIWLEQKLNNRFVAGVKVGTNLNSRIKEGKYFNESATTNPLYGQITLRFNLNK